jgi:hypothetical protein
MTIALNFEKDDFSSLLEGERDFDISRQMSHAIRTRLSACMREAIGDGWLKHTHSGKETFSTVAGPVGSPGFSLARMHEEGGFYAWDFRVSVDASKGTTKPIREIEAGPGLDFSHSTTSYDGRLWPPKLDFRVMARRDRHTLRCYSLHVDARLLPLDTPTCRSCACPVRYLRPVTVSMTANILSWMCICCGSRHLCECSRGYLEALQIRNGYDNSDYITLGQLSDYRQAICHLCRNIPSEVKYRSDMYGGPIYQYYFPYMLQEASLHGTDIREGENRVRDRLGLPRIGEGWLNEMMIINASRIIFPELHIEHQASPSWLGRQRYDAYITEHRIAIEYNGEQHYHPVERFGGVAGLVATQSRDREKLQLSARHGVKVVIFRFDELISEAVIRERIEAAIRIQTSSKTPITT